MNARALILGSVFLTLAARADEPAPAAPAKLEDLQREVEKIREGLFTSRARAAATAGALYSSKLQVYLHFGTPRFFHVSRATVRLDGAAVWDDTAGAIAADDLARWDGFVAPGKHLVTVRVDCEAKDDTGFASSTEATFTVDVPQHKLVAVRALAEDGGDLASSWAKKGRGGYRLHVDADVEAHELPGTAGNASGPASGPATGPASGKADGAKR
jgi:hypothetical protein